VRGPEPEWYDAALSANSGEHGNTTWSLSKKKLEHLKIHTSETAWVGTEFDAILDNNYSIDDLYAQVISLVPNLPVAT
jgi:hypothetical protein